MPRSQPELPTPLAWEGEEQQRALEAQARAAALAQGYSTVSGHGVEMGPRIDTFPAGAVCHCKCRACGEPFWAQTNQVISRLPSLVELGGRNLAPEESTNRAHRADTFCSRACETEFAARAELGPDVVEAYITQKGTHPGF
jgi:hypothetical protein